MASIVFIAVQCCQCSTMQVKQKKKSSNKWTCAVCNQKQSVRKIFAQGYKAKDIRKFVQSFNMSRNDGGDHQSLTEIASPVDSGSLLEHQQKKRRCDWSEYLDVEEDGNKDNVKEEDEEDGLRLKIVTELPQEMFMKSKLRKHCSGSGTGGGGSDDLYRPAFSKRNIKRPIVSQEKEAKENQPAKVIGYSNRNGYMTRNFKEQQNPTQLTMATKASKWNAYIAHDEDEFKAGSGTNFVDEMDHCSNIVWEAILDNQKVEDDIHPDFI
ncbi:MRN complex-interacting protein isoform X2 [Jatropha curcas]|uniref:MRN complex-interacting protein isoform X2 n=1 Tax=Jatropha curcas TaxID=180498 RepID=UPI0009D76A25|nr:MRN complex-interacting protein isoform X2 [Jatropha curcas]